MKRDLDIFCYWGKYRSFIAEWKKLFFFLIIFQFFFHDKGFRIFLLLGKIKVALYREWELSGWKIALGGNYRWELFYVLCIRRIVMI